MSTARVVALFCLLTVPALSAPAQNRDYEAERRYLESLRRDIDNAKREARNLENAIDDRRKQLADAPKTIKPAEEAAAEANRRFEKAKANLPKARTRLDAANEKLKAVLAELKTSDESARQLDEAENKLGDAEFRLDSLRKPVLEKLYQRDDYRKLADPRDAAEKRVKALKDEAAPPAELIEAANQLLLVNTNINNLEDEELEKNEQIKAARKALEAAVANAKAVRLAVAERLKNNPRFVAADQDAAAARQAFADANKELTESSRERYATINKVTSLKSQARRFEQETNALAARKVQVENRIRTLEKRYDDYRRNNR
jgi:chromosome segregation ATPase